MKVKLLHNTPLVVDAIACRTCWGSQGKSDTITTHISDSYGAKYDIRIDDQVIGENDKELIDRVGNKFKHKSILEHVSYNFFISGVSRALLQELARHRTAKLSVKSTRYTLKELKNEEPFVTDDFDYKGWLTGKPDAVGGFFAKSASKYLVWTENNRIDISSVVALENLRIQLKSGISNDIAKYCLPESYKTELTWTMDARNLQSFLSLRSDKSALWEIRELAHAIYKEIPYDHKYLFEAYIKPVVPRPTHKETNEIN